MSDKQLTEEPSGLKISSVAVKGFALANGWLALYAGSGTFAQVVVEIANDGLGQLLAGGTAAPDTAVGTMLWLKDAYQRAYDAITRFDVFGPKLLDRDKFVARTYDEATIRQVEGLLYSFIEDDTADILAVGFDRHGDGQIVVVNAETEEVSDSFATIGSGGGIAGAHLSWRGTGFKDRLQRVVYEVYEAKAHAQRNAYVGEETDAFVIFHNGPSGGVYLTRDTLDSLGVVVEHYDKVPIVGARRPDKKIPKEPPTDWEHTLTELKLGPVVKVVESYRSHPQDRAKWGGGSSASGQPSSQSQSGGPQ